MQKYSGNLSDPEEVRIELFSYPSGDYSLFSGYLNSSG